MTLLLIYLAIALVFSFLCSILEAVILSITPSFININMQEGKKSGKELKKLKDDIDRPLSALLTLNTFANTAGAAGVGAQAPLIWGNEALTVISLILTLLILFLSEIIPKTIGAVYWRKLASFAAITLRVMVIIFAPAVWVSQFLTRIIKRGHKRKSVLSRADFRAMTDIGLKHGVFHLRESEIIKNLLNFNEVLVKSIMTPRTILIAANEETTIKDFYEQNKDLRFSRVPIFKDSIDNISGFILKDDILTAVINNKTDSKLKEFRRKIDYIPDVAQIPELFTQLIEKNSHIVAVVDEHGGTAGIVTMEDIIETLLGLEITDEMDNVEDLQALARKNWEKRAKKLGLLKG